MRERIQTGGRRIKKGKRERRMRGEEDERRGGWEERRMRGEEDGRRR